MLSALLDLDLAHAFDCHIRSTVENDSGTAMTKNWSHAPTVTITFKNDLHPTYDARNLPQSRSRSA